MMSIAVSLLFQSSSDARAAALKPVLVRFRIDGLFEVYDLLPDEVRAELPLRRAWMPTPT